MEVLLRRHNHRVSRISAAAERSIPAKIVTERIDMRRLWISGMWPKGTERLRRSTAERSTWREEETAM